MHAERIHLHHDYIDTPHHAEFAVVDAATAAARYQQAAGTAQTRWVEGVAATTKDPGQAAAAAQNRLLVGFQNAVNSGLWARRVQEGGSLANWKQKSQDKANNYSVGINSAQAAYQQGYTAFWNYMQAYYPTIVSNPDPKSRMNAWFDAASAYQKA
jgi:hypothetical protein